MQDLTADNALFTDIFVLSDERIKQRIRNLDSTDTEALLQLDCFKFVFNNQQNTEARYGLSAQQVQTFFPELVHNSRNNQYLILQYLGMIPILINALKEMDARLKIMEG